VHDWSDSLTDRHKPRRTPPKDSVREELDTASADCSGKNLNHMRGREQQGYGAWMDVYLHEAWSDLHFLRPGERVLQHAREGTCIRSLGIVSTRYRFSQ
jgi:hypothetical protein